MGYGRTLRVEFDGGKVARRLNRAGAKIEIGMGTVRREFTARSVGRARQTAGSLGDVHRHILPGILIIGGAAQSTIKLDLRKQPAILGAEFGGQRRSTTQQFRPYRGSGPRAGYFLYPSLRAESRQLDRLVLGLIERAL